MRYSRMKTALLFVFVGGFVVANTWSAILFKLAADDAGKKAVWSYVVGNLIGALGPLALTFALKRGHPNVIYALCFGCSFAAVQIMSSRYFHQPLSMLQWAGVAAVGIGICLLQFGDR